MYKKILSSLTMVSLIALGGCASKNKEEKFDAMSAQELYQTGIAKAKKKHYTLAVEHFEALEARYPFGEYAEKGKLVEIFSYYKNHDYPSALATAQGFIRLHPRHDHVDYAYYMKGLSHFAESMGTISKYLPMESSERDVQSSKDAFNAFSELVNRFPYSRYTPDAKRRIVYLRNVIAENELHAARFYMDREAYVAANNRAQTIVQHFDQAPSVEEALYIQVLSYRHLKMQDLADDSLRILRLNFPHSAYLKELV